MPSTHVLDEVMGQRDAYGYRETLGHLPKKRLVTRRGEVVKCKRNPREVRTAAAKSLENFLMAAQARLHDDGTTKLRSL